MKKKANGGLLKLSDKLGTTKGLSAVSGVADMGSEFIDMFAKPTEVVNNKVNVNEGAAAGKGALKGAASGAALGSIIPGLGTLVGGAAGALIGGLGSFFGGRKQEKDLQEGLDEQLDTEQFNSALKTRLTTMNQSPTYTPVAKQGGFIVYKGETHEGPTGGNLVDEIGNPTGLSSSKPIALTEKNEVSKYDPTTGNTYIYSDSLGFAKPATHLVRKYELDKPSWNNLYKNDSLLRTAVDKQFENLTQAQEFSKETNTSMKDTMTLLPTAGKGGYLSTAKAKEILKDGKANGKRLTNKQRAYMGWVAGGKKEDGGLLEDGPYGDRSIENPSMNYMGDILPKYGGEGESFIQKLKKSYKPTNTKPNPDSPFLQLYFRGQEPTGTPSILRNDNVGGGTATGFPYILKDFYNKQQSSQDKIPNKQLEWWAEYLKSGKIKGPESTSNAINRIEGPGRVSADHISPGSVVRKSYNDIYNPLAGSPNQYEPTEEDNYSPTLSPLGHMASALGNLADYRALKQAKPSPVNLPRVGAEQINLAKQRLINQRGAEDARNMNVTNARNLGLNAGSMFSNLAASNTGVSKLLGQQNMESALAEETTNAQLRQQANAMNVEVGAQEGLFNTQQDNAYRMARARLNPLSNLARTAASYAADNASYKKGYNTAEMLAPNMELYKDPDANALNWLLENRGVKVRAKK